MLWRAYVFIPCFVLVNLASERKILSLNGRIIACFSFAGARSHVRRMKNLTSGDITSELNSLEPMNSRLSNVQPAFTSARDRHVPNDGPLDKKTSSTTPAPKAPAPRPTGASNGNSIDHHRIVLGRYVLHASVKQTVTRWVRETPV